MKKKFIYFFIAIIFLLHTFAASVSAVKTTYTVSDAYRESIYYERLSALDLTGDERRDIVNVAMTQLGYHEGNSASELGGGNWNGTGNCVEYNYGNKSVYSNGGTYSYAWCASFVTWCARQAGISTSTVINSVSCDNFVSNFKSRSQYKTRSSGYKPIAGDLIFFLSSDSNRTYASHVGIVVGTDSSGVYTIEGNTTRGFVNYRRYSLNSTYIVGYGIPAYAGTSGKYEDFSFHSGYIEPGIYAVNSSSGILNLRSGPSTSYSSLTTIPSGTLLAISEASGDWGWVVYKGKSGWISLNYVEPSQITVSYNANGGESAPASTVNKSLKAVTLSSDIPSREGYTFLGWAKKSNSSTVDYLPGDIYVDISDITLYAIWERTQYTVEFLDYDGRVISQKIYYYGDETEIPDDPQKESDVKYEYSFFGWDREIVNRVTADISYKAVYVALPIEEEEDKPNDTEHLESEKTDTETQAPETDTREETHTEAVLRSETLKEENLTLNESSCAQTGIEAVVSSLLLVFVTVCFAVLDKKK